MRFFEEITSYSNTMIRKVFAMIRAAFKLAYERGIIDIDLITHHSIKCPKSSKSDREVRGLTENEQQKFIHALMKHKVPHGRNTYKTQLLLEIYTGMRMGEINALKPEDINFSEGYIHVGATISRGLGSLTSPLSTCAYTPYPFESTISAESKSASTGLSQLTFPLTTATDFSS
jgi:integrase